MNLSLKELLSKFSQKHLLVVGDVMLDKYVWGTVDRISPEAPVPIVDITKTEYHAGGAANVAQNIHGLDAKVTLIGMIGDDEDGELLKSVIKKNTRLDFKSILEEKRQTTVKTRIMAQGQQILRLDHENTDSLKSETFIKLKKLIKSSLDDVDGIILQDYEKGIFSKEIIQWVMKICKENSLPVYVDPKDKNYIEFSGARLLKPNLSEFNKNVNINQDILANAESLRLDNNYDILLVTMGEKGMAIFSENEQRNISTQARSVNDVSGAGDTVIATFALSDLCGNSPFDSAWLANHAAGRVCEEVGVVPIDTKILSEMLAEHLD